MRILIALFLVVTLTSCGALLEPMFKDISSGITQYVQQDSCKKILTAKVIDFRLRNKSFPNHLSDLDSLEFNSNQLKTTLELMWLTDSINLQTKIDEFDQKWKCDCPNQFDSISLTAYKSDSIDIYTILLKFKTDTTYSKIIENRRIVFINDSLSKINQMIFDIKTYDLNGNEIEFLRKGKSNRINKKR
ncbi:MAG: hypothetical protein N4A74_13465 [Carboxylicivirga sp.]|jgi:hypothetical protein|nr:hypothetical protein [Carboxylicivirga sp.]